MAEINDEVQKASVAAAGEEKHTGTEVCATEDSSDGEEMRDE